ncbi:AfsR/SARP family transcriptional regulator [Phytomonospora endophytica]|uniref:DNA-binding SARP family transcriptional activator/tetratricopeptide (TPR) repeat protein n=1 Tax=Phytomonospora endophytica TaxID=714109 RepID=A0A841FGL5_9ACTN|nr:BTAD domain-containing putative transcriptional regulator [Phytomonospora endophytica]MBB6034795.1 DNA-binding SARP family transcriptional activator/tetratricopeptide (TPR) repeat protein [Phytomonospora endophytica]GIG69002.1 SARP family transcriptional regulator [Phytomonospora endophytica]
MPANAPARLRVLGPVELLVDGRDVDLGGLRSRALVTALALTPGDVASTDRLIDLVWGAEPPKTAANQLQIAVHRVRTALTEAGLDAHATLRREGGGYVLDGLAADLTDFRAGVATGETAAHAGDWNAARAAFQTALALWRGPACPDLAGTAVVNGIEEERLSALEQRMVADLLAGDPAPVLTDAPGLLTERPLRERVLHLLVLAHALSGDRARARKEHERACAAIVEALGIDPGPELRDLDPEGELAPALDRLHTWIAGPPPAPAVRPRELPAHIRDFVGRPGELAALADGLKDAADGAGAVLTVVGLGGVGKTALAVHAAHAASWRFPDGCLFADLRGAEPEPRDPHAVLAVFLRSLGVPDDAVPTDGTARITLYRRLLSERRVLIVCDNAFDAEQVRPLLPDTAGSAVVVTARADLSRLDPAVAVRLDALTEDDSVELLTRLSRGSSGHDRERLHRLAALAGGLPLALRIVGARIARRGFHLDRIIARLTDEQRRLDALSDGDLRVRSCVDVGYRRLSEPAAAMLRAVALLPATDIGLWLAAAAVNTPSAEAAPLAAELAEAQLIRLTENPGSETRVTLHDLVRVFARGEATDPDHAGLAQGFEALLGLTHTASEALRTRIHVPPIPPRGFTAPEPAALDTVRSAPRAWFAREHEVLSAAVTAATAYPDLAWRLALAPVTFLEQGFHIDTMRRIHGAVAAMRPFADPHAEAGLDYLELKILTAESRRAEALRLARPARRAFLDVGDPLRAAAVAVELAKAVRLGGGNERIAIAALRWALARLDELPPDPSVHAQRGWTLLSLTAIVVEKDQDEAHDLYERAIAEFELGDDTAGAARARGALGVVYQRSGDHRRAIAILERALSAYIALGLSVDRLYCQVFIASNLLLLGDHAEAVRRCDEAIEELRATPYPALFLGIVHVKGSALHASGDFAASRDVLREGLDLAQELGAGYVQAKLQYVLVKCLVGLGVTDEAAAAVERLIELLPPDDPRIAETRALLTAS